MNMKDLNKIAKACRVLIPYGTVLVLTVVWADFLQAGLDEQVKKAGTFLNGPMLKTGLGGATIVGTIGAAVRGSIAMAAGVMGVGIALAFYLGWLNSDHFVQAAN